MFSQIDLSHNDLVREDDMDGVKAFAEAIRATSSLLSINLKTSGLDSKGAKALALGLRDSVSLTSVNLSHNNLTNYGRDMTGIKAIADALVVAFMTSIVLNDTWLGPDGAKALAPALRDNASLTELSVADNNLCPSGAQAIAGEIKANKSLKKLDISNCNIKSEGAIYIAEAIATNVSITSINLSANSLGREGGKSLVSALRGSTSITSIDVGYNRIGKTVSLELLDAMKGNRMMSIGMANCDLDIDGSGALAEMMSFTPSMRSINIKANIMCTEGAIVFETVLRNHPLITSIDIGSNGIDQSTSLDLLNAIKDRNMVNVGMAACSLGVEGSKVVAEMISVMPSLTSIDLKYNDLHHEGALALAPAIRDSPSLTRILLGSNFGPQDVQMIIDIVQGNSTIKHLDLWSGRH